MKKGNNNILISFIISTVIILICWLFYNQILVDNRIFKLLGGDIIGGGYIQLLTYFTFFWAYMETRANQKMAYNEYESFNLSLLPTDEHYVLYPEDINKLRMEVVNQEKTKAFLLTGLIKKSCTKFLRTNSVAEIQELIASQVNINKAKAESRQSIIRYLLWAIPSLGFIGTVLGISQALGFAGNITNGDTKIVTDTLGVAFDTTLVALILSMIAMWLFHQLQAEEDQLHADMEEYMINNLVNRIDTKNA